jgi:multidrug resistance efflux pump
MDVMLNKKQKKLKILLKRKKTLPLLIFAMVTFVVYSQTNRNTEVPINQLTIKTIKTGDLAINITSYGKLASKEIRLITTPVGATVESIKLKPGAIVTPKSIILKLNNPQIEQKVEAAQLAVFRAQANYKKLEIELEDNKLGQKSTIAQLTSELKASQLKFQAESALAKSGIISKLQIKTTEIITEQLVIRLEIEQQRMAHLLKVNQARLSVEKDYLKLYQSQLSLHQNQQKSLTIVAGIHGVLQHLPVKLGQNIPPGGKLAIVGSIDNLIAELKVPQSSVSNVMIGNSVNIKVNTISIIGQVTRIEPIVTNGFVTIEASLPLDLPLAARPELSIQADITTSVIKSTLYVEKPSYVNANSITKTFIYHQNEHTALKSAVQFGQTSGQYIQILAGARVNDQLVISAINQWQKKQSIKIIM